MSKTERQRKRDNRIYERHKEIKWDKLDNTAHLFPVIAGIGVSNVYRISMVLKEPVNRDLLQQALDETLPLFPVFNTRLRQGMFWYYFEENGKRAPKVVEENTYPCQYIEAAANRSYLFRVTYYKCRINLEVFHVLADGMGGMNFLRELTYKYLRLAHEELAEKVPDCLSKDTSLDATDSFLENYTKGAAKTYKSEVAYLLKGDTFERGKMGLFHGHLQLNQVKQRAKAYGATINEYLVSALCYSIYKEKLHSQPVPEPITVSVPVNLRPYFQSNTTRNFFVMVTAVFRAQRENHTFEDVIASVRESLRPQMTREHLEAVFSYNVSNEKKLMLRAVPWMLKKPAMKYVYNAAAKANTTTVTNVGSLQIEEAYRPYVENYFAFISRSKGQDLKCAISSYENHLNLVVTSVLKDVEVQRGLFSFLAEDGIDIVIEDNGVYEEGQVQAVAGEENNPVLAPERDNYPEVEKKRHRMKLAVAICWLCAIVAYTALRIVAAKVPFDKSWDGLIGGCLLYLMFTFHVSFLGRRGYQFKMIMQTIGGLLLVILIDIILGFHGWSLNYVLPGVFVLTDVAILILMLVNSRNWQSYIPVQMLLVLLSLIGVILYALDVIKVWPPALLGFAIVCVIFVCTVIIGGSRSRQELRRRFHL